MILVTHLRATKTVQSIEEAMTDFVEDLHLAKFNPIYKEMAAESPQVLMNLEFLLDSFFEMNINYHKPKEFTSSYNNLERNIYYFIESAKKSPLSEFKWLKKSIDMLHSENNELLAMHREIRRQATHLRFLVPDDAAIIFGLYRLKSSSECILKLGIGDLDKSKRTKLTEYLYFDTEKIFHKVLFFHEFMFIDFDHSSSGECLGVTRNWFSEVSYNHNGNSVAKKINLYDEASKIVDLIINEVTKSFAEERNIAYALTTFRCDHEYNFINTVLEIDLFPEQFRKWWDDESIEPFNYAYILKHREHIDAETKKRFYHNIFGMKYESITGYLAKLDQYSNVTLDTFLSQDEYNEFVNFIYYNHMYIKQCVSAFDKTSELFTILLELRKAIEYYIEYFDSEFEKHAPEVINGELSKICRVVKSLRDMLRKIA